MVEIGKKLKTKHLIIISSAFILSIVSAILALAIGTVNISIAEIFNSLFNPDSHQQFATILWDIRLPRVLMSFAVGGGLAITGTVLQAILMNPLAEPYILGISSGGSFGALLAILLGLSFVFIQIFAFAGALLVMLLVFVLGKRFGELEPNILLLSGVMVGAFFSAAIMLLIFFMGDSLRSAIYWLMGNLSSASSSDLIYILPIVLIALIYFSFNASKLNILSFGSADANNLGIDINNLKTSIYIISGVVVGAVVSVSGIIGFVGLLVPHVCRMLWGYDNRILVPTSFFIGAAYLTVADTIARNVLSPVEIPVGAVTSILGAPLFIHLLRRRFRAF